MPRHARGPLGSHARRNARYARRPQQAHGPLKKIEYTVLLPPSHALSLPPHKFTHYAVSHGSGRIAGVRLSIARYPLMTPRAVERYPNPSCVRCPSTSRHHRQLCCPPSQSVSFVGNPTLNLSSTTRPRSKPFSTVFTNTRYIDVQRCWRVQHSIATDN